MLCAGIAGVANRHPPNLESTLLMSKPFIVTPFGEPLSMFVKPRPIVKQETESDTRSIEDLGREAAEAAKKASSKGPKNV